MCHPYGILPPSFFMGSAGFTGGYQYVALTELLFTSNVIRHGRYGPEIFLILS